MTFVHSGPPIVGNGGHETVENHYLDHLTRPYSSRVSVGLPRPNTLAKSQNGCTSSPISTSRLSLGWYATSLFPISTPLASPVSPWACISPRSTRPQATPPLNSVYRWRGYPMPRLQLHSISDCLPVGLLRDTWNSCVISSWARLS